MQLPLIDEHVENMLCHDVIKPAIVMVCKHDSTMQFCVDYRKTNELIKKGKFPLPKIDACLDTLNSCHFFSSYYLHWGCWQIVINKRDRDKTVFVTRKGQWLKPRKCQLFQCKVIFLGHVVSDQGIEYDLDKVATIASWPWPMNISEVRTFYGQASYYRAFVQDFAHVAKPLHSLTRKNVPFNWDDD